MFIVYKHTSPNGKVYIGLTGRKNVNLRWCNGLGYSGNKHFTNAIKKYGWDNFQHEIIKTDLSFDEACEWEIKLIAEYKANNPKYGYNISSGGYCGTLGTHHSEETKQKISASNIGKVRTQETRRRISEAQKGLPSPMKGKHHSEETKQKISKANTGYKHTDEAKKKISDASKSHIRKTGYKLTDEHKQHISNSLKGKKKSVEHIEKVRKANSGRHFTEEHKKKLSESHKGHKLSEEQKRKISESMKKYQRNKKK